MHHARLVHIREPLGDLHGERERGLEREPLPLLPPCDELLEGGVAQLGDEVEVVVVRAAAIEVEYVRVA